MWDRSKYPNLADGHQYALDVISGQIIANIWVTGACKRYLNDLERCKHITSWKEYDERGEDVPFIFRPDKAEKYLRIVQKFHHPVGEWSTPNIVYEAWQKFAWMNIKGFYNTETRMIRFRTAHIDIARGNAKSAMASQATLYDLCCDNPNGNRVYCAATSRDQAKEVFNGAKTMAMKSQSFAKRFNIDIRAHEILHPGSNSYFKPISAQANSLDGKNGKLIVTDELHAMKRETYEVLESGQSKRRDSLLLSITTAGYKSDGVGFSQRRYAQKVAIGEHEDDTFFALVFRLDEEDDPFDETVWIKANPNMGVSVDPINFKAKAGKARVNPEDARNFKIKHLNMYMDSLNQLLDVVRWVRCRDEKLDISKYAGQKCYVGLDLSSKLDITSICYTFKEEDKYIPFWKNFIPEERLSESRNQNYARYVEEGDLIALPGDMTDLDAIEKILLEDSRIFRFLDIFYDPWSATQMAVNLEKQRMSMVEFRMNTGNLSEPTKAWQAYIIAQRFKHNSKSMIEWCTTNVVGKYDAVGNVFPRKEDEKLKIDPIISGIMSLAGWIKQEQEESVYEKRGMIVI